MSRTDILFHAFRSPDPMEDRHTRDELVRLLVESVKDQAMFALDAGGRIATWSEGAERILGYPAAEARGRPLALIGPRWSADGAERALRLAGERGRFEVEEEWVRKDGSAFRAAVVISALGDGAAELAGYGVVVRDLTDRLHGEKALQQRNALVKLLQVVAVAANEADSVESALQACLDAVCDHTGWPVGHAYLVGRAGILEPTRIWHVDNPERFRLFREVTEATVFRPGEGLLGEVFAEGEPGWVEDVSREPGFVRTRAGEIGVRGAFALPILVGRAVLGVLEFFSDEPAAPDLALLEVLGHLGAQVGRVVERARAEEALRLSEAKFGGIIGISSDGIVSVDESQRITLFNQGAEQIFGYTEEEVLGQPLEILIPERFRALHAGHVRTFGESSVSARRMGERGEIQGRRKSGEVFPADASISKLEVDGKRIYTAVLRDVTEQRRVEQALRLSEAKFSGIISLASDAIVSVDRSQRIVLFNRGAEQIFGYTGEEVLGQPLEILIPEPSRAGHAHDVREFEHSPVVARRMGERGEIQGRRKSGEVFPAEASISRIEVAGEVLLTAVLRDITERKRAEEALTGKAEELSRSNAELEQFAYVASHDLQEPLRKIQAFGDRLASRYAGALDEQGKDYLARMHNAAERMQALINDLLTFSRVTTKAQPFAPVDLGQVVREVVSDLELRIEQSGARVEVGGLPVIQADPLQMRQLFQNLIVNALKFQREGVSPVVRVSSRLVQSPAPGGRRRSAWYEIAVEDNGIGFDEKYLDRIFQLFQRLHGRSRYEGTGMGLAICRKIAERHGGTIDARSTPGEGATFLVTLPARHSAKEPLQ